MCDNIVIEELGYGSRNRVVQWNYLPNLLHWVAEKMSVAGDVGAGVRSWDQ